MLSERDHDNDNTPRKESSGEVNNGIEVLRELQYQRIQ